MLRKDRLPTYAGMLMTLIGAAGILYMLNSPDPQPQLPTITLECPYDLTAPAKIISTEEPFIADEKLVNDLWTYTSSATTEDIIQAADLALSDNSKNYYAYMVRGSYRIEEGDYQSAIEDFTQAINLNPSYTEALLGRAEAYQKLYDFRSAIADYTSVLKLSPHHYMALYERGLAYVDVREFHLALDDLNHLLEIHPDASHTYTSLGIVYSRRGEFELAFINYACAIALEPENHLPYYNRSIDYYSLGLLDEALKDLIQSSELDPTFPDSYWGIGNVYQDRGNKQRALENYHRYVELSEEQDLQPDPGVLAMIEELEGSNSILP